MAKSHFNAQNNFHEEEDYTELEGSNDPDSDSDDTEEDPTYIYDLDIPQFKLSNLSIKTNPNYRDDAKTEINDEEVSDMEELSAPKLGIKDLKSLEEVQRIIDCGKVEKLKLEQCKVYLRKHGLRLTGTKGTLVQRIKEHLEILNGGGEKKFPPSSFVLNCKGDACMGDIVMFEQTVYEGYNIASRSAIGPPRGKRTVAGRIVKESYGAAKQQHTFTVEVLWSKGDKPLPPLHPLLIKGRNLYRLNTLRQRWEDESERQRALNEKHSRGLLARSNREARIQEKASKKNSKGIRSSAKEGQNSLQEKNHKHATDHIPIHGPKHLGSMKTQKQHSVQQAKQLEQNIPVSVEFKVNAYPGLPVSQPSQQNKLKVAPYISNQQSISRAYKDPNSSLSCFAPPKLEHSRLAESTLQSHYGHSRHYNWEYKHHQEKMPSTSTCNFFNQKPRSHYTENGGFATSATAPLCLSFWDKSRNPQHESWYVNQLLGSNGRINQKEQQQPCRYYPQGKCYYGDHCRFLHESNWSRC